MARPPIWQIGNTGQPIDPLIKAQFPSPSGGIPGDPYYSNVTVLISQTVANSAPTNNALTVDGSIVSTSSGVIPLNYQSVINFPPHNPSDPPWGLLTGALAQPTQNYTLEFLIAPNTNVQSPGSDQSVFTNCQTNGYPYAGLAQTSIRYNDSTQNLTGQLFSVGFTTTVGSVPLGVPTSVVFAIDETSLHVFINGVLNTTSGSTGNWGASAGNPALHIGKYNLNLNLYNTAFYGSLAGIRITNDVIRYTVANPPPATPSPFPSATFYVPVSATSGVGPYGPISLYYPGRGQYWLFFGPQAFVLTINGAGRRTWSRYVFPDTITDWTLNAGVLYLRTAGNLVWQLDPNTLVDDASTLTTGANTPFNSVIQWPYLDMGGLGINKMLVGIDIVGTGSVIAQVAFNQSDASTFNDNPNFATSTGVTAPYFVTVDDTVPGEPLPIPINAPSYSLILTFPSVISTTSAVNNWGWSAANLYITDARGGGATG